MVREAEWTDDDRRQMRELDIYEAGVHTCGYHRDLVTDPDNGFMPETFDCPVCAGAQRYARMLRRSDDLHRDKNDPYAPDPADGRSVYMRLMPPDEVARARSSSK